MATPQDSINSFVREDFQMPESYDEAKIYLREYLRDIVLAINARDIGQYTESQIVTGQKFFTANDNNALKQVYRKVIDISNAGGIIAGSPYAHGITWTANTRVTRLYGVATEPSTGAIPIPYVDVGTPANGLQLDVDTASVVLTTGAGVYTGYTSGYVVIEYVQT